MSYLSIGKYKCGEFRLNRMNKSCGGILCKALLVAIQRPCVLLHTFELVGDAAEAF